MHGNRWSAAWRRLFGLRGRRIEAEVDDELRFHLEMRAREAEARGVDPREARRQALTRFGDLAAASAECADIDRMHLQAQRRREWLGDLARDLRFAVRVLGRQRSAAVVIVACLALGIGSATTVFTVGDALLRRPMPFPAGDRLVAVGTDMRGTGGLSVSSFEDFTDWKERQHTFAAIGAVQPVAFALAGPQVVRVNGAQVTSGVLAS
ncbi:MAG TPA: permease prefix domain 1-containing protein, partial [Gemmatimonadaceae bacterium]|nr:permease prefix domain 1-containing protein [Gemmatimonadaceae bacterium]